MPRTEFCLRCQNRWPATDFVYKDDGKLARPATCKRCQAKREHYMRIREAKAAKVAKESAKGNPVETAMITPPDVWMDTDKTQGIPGR